MHKVNERGLRHLKTWIDATTGHGGYYGPIHTTLAYELDWWAREAEQSMIESGKPMVLMHSISTKSGQDEIFIIPDDGIYWDDESCSP